MSDILEAAEMLSRHKELAVLQFLAPFNGPVLVAGAYKGDTIKALRLMDTEVPIHAFEPQPWCWDHLAALRAHDDNLYIHQVALGGRIERVSLNRVGSDFASLLDINRQDEESVEVQMVEIEEYLKQIPKPPEHWGLWILNMEGYEYPLLEYLTYKTSVFSKVDNLLVQCHPKVAGVSADTKVYPTVPALYKLRWNNYPAWLWWSKV